MPKKYNSHLHAHRFLKKENADYPNHVMNMKEMVLYINRKYNFVIHGRTKDLMRDGFRRFLEDMGQKKPTAYSVNKKKIKTLKQRKGFYQSEEWLNVRYQALVKYGRKCQCCGAVPPYVVLHVDHVKPRSKYPELELDINNLQILCHDCNMGKSNKDDTDFR